MACNTEQASTNGPTEIYTKESSEAAKSTAKANSSGKTIVITLVRGLMT